MLTVAIAGFGPRGLSILERLVSKIIAGSVQYGVNILLFDPNSSGAGCHNSKQNQRLLANTVAAQMTIFCDETISDKEFFLNGPNFYEYLIMNGYEADKNGYYSRKLLGDYLSYCFGLISKYAPHNIKISFINEKVEKINKTDKFILTTKNNEFTADAVFVVTGHNYDRKNSLSFPCYPIEQAISGLSGSSTVAIKGLGLSFIDLITLLTSGSGGYFIRKQGELKYIPSGNEPNIFAFSRSNIHLMARAINQKEVREQ